jgi:hypothetical protein
MTESCSLLMDRMDSRTKISYSQPMVRHKATSHKASISRTKRVISVKKKTLCQQMSIAEQDTATGATMPLAGVESGEFEQGDHQFLFAQSIKYSIRPICSVPAHWILLDNQSTVDVFHSRHLLTNIRLVPTNIEIHCNAGVTTTNMVGGSTWVWHGLVPS